ncbi:MAG: AAA family ATPase [Candidatus Altiarchaeota archaeon]|nr:AAA family ATPase [Candidatus Altiarchaeota archaeon]
MIFDHKGIDGLVGGIEPGIVSAIVGKAGTGKTTLSLAIAKSATNPYLLDTEGLSLKRVEQLGLTDRLNIMKVRSFKDQHRTIQRLSRLAADADLLIIDSLVMLYRLVIKQNPEKINTQLSLQMAELHKLAEAKSIPVIVTGHIYEHEKKKHITGGDILKYWAKMIVLIERTGRPGVRKASVIKHRWMPEAKSCRFRLTQTGIG